MIAVAALLLVLIGVPALVYLSDRRRSRRTRAELDDEAVRVAKGADDGPGSNEPVRLPRRGPLPPASF